MLVFIAGGTGFVGSHLMEALRQRGVKGRCLLRTPSKAKLCEGFEAVEGSIERKLSPKAFEGVDMVVHLVGIISEETGQTFRDVHIRGTENLVSAAIEAGVKRFFYQSALGASATKESKYMRTKAEAEEIVKDSGMEYTIFRPSLILGPWDRFSLQMTEVIRRAPVVPVPGDGETKFQPLYIKDWVKCFLSVLEDGSRACGTFELGGPEHLSFNRITEIYMDALGIHKRIIHLPVGLVKAGVHMAFLAKAVGIKSLPPVSREQIEMLGEDNITRKDIIRETFGFEPVKVSDALKEFLRTSEVPSGRT